MSSVEWLKPGSQLFAEMDAEVHGDLVMLDGSISAELDNLTCTQKREKVWSSLHDQCYIVGICLPPLIDGSVLAESGDCMVCC